MQHGAGGTGYAKEQTEWDQALQKYGIGKYEGIEEVKQEKVEVVSEEERARLAKEKHLREASVEELDELEDDEDERVLRKLREARLSELRAQAAAKTRQGSVLREIFQQQWKEEVTEAAFASTVVALLFKPGDEWCTLLDRLLATVAGRFPRIKFVKIVYTSAIHDFPASLLPCLLVYNKSDPIKQITGFPYGGGAKATADDVEWTLHCKGVLKSEMEENPRTAGSSSADSVKYNYVGAAHMEDY